MCVTICGRFCPDEGAVVGYGNRIRVKYTAKWGVQIAEMVFQTRSSIEKPPSFRMAVNTSKLVLDVWHHSKMTCSLNSNSQELSDVSRSFL